MYTGIGFIILIFIIVILHEFGHFYTARKFGITVHEFSVGMGPELFSKTKNDVKFALRAIPMGGYVKIEGEDSLSDDENSFRKKSPIKRIIVLAAGSFMNLISGLILFCILGIFIGTPSTTIENITENSPAYLSGLLINDKIISIEGKSIRKWEDIGDIISNFDEQDMKITVKRNNENIDFILNPEYNEELGRKTIGITPKNELNIIKGLKNGFVLGIDTTKEILTAFKLLITGQISLKEMGGPIAIATISGEALKDGPLSFVWILAFISINLGIMNLLPLPALDGGRIVFAIIEIIRKGNPISIKTEAYIHLCGMFLFFVLMGVITFNDLVKSGIFWYRFLLYFLDALI